MPPSPTRERRWRDGSRFEITGPAFTGDGSSSVLPVRRIETGARALQYIYSAAHAQRRLLRQAIRGAKDDRDSVVVARSECEDPAAILGSAQARLILDDME